MRITARFHDKNFPPGGSGRTHEIQEALRLLRGCQAVMKAASLGQLSPGEILAAQAARRNLARAIHHRLIRLGINPIRARVWMGHHILWVRLEGWVEATEASDCETAEGGNWKGKTRRDARERQ